MNRLETLAGVLFVIAVPALLIAGSVAWAVNDAGLYARGFAKYDIAQRTGITEADLNRVGAELRQYFNSNVEPLSVRAAVYGMEREMFNRREVAHMRDVKGLVQGTYWVALLSGLLILAVAGAGFARRRWAYADTLARLLRDGGLLTLALVALVGIFALVGFDALFLLFHRISFANDLWQLNPRTDYLLLMFPIGFWFDATLRVALTAIAGALVCVAAGVGWRWWGRAGVATG